MCLFGNCNRAVLKPSQLKPGETHRKRKTRSRGMESKSQGLFQRRRARLTLQPIDHRCMVLPNQSSEGQCMFSNLAVDTVQGALPNLAIIADLGLFIAKLECGKCVANSKQVLDIFREENR